MTDFSKPGTLTGKFDKFGHSVTVGCHIKALITWGAEVKEISGTVIHHFSPVKGYVFAVECSTQNPRLFEYYPLSEVFDITVTMDHKTDPNPITADLRLDSWSCPAPNIRHITAKDRFPFATTFEQDRIGTYTFSGIDKQGNKITLNIETKQLLDRVVSIEIKPEKKIQDKSKWDNKKVADFLKWYLDVSDQGKDYYQDMVSKYEKEQI